MTKKKDEDKLKPGKLSLDEIDFIKKNADSMSAKEIAKFISRSPRRVQRFIDEEAIVSVDMEEQEAIRTIIRKELFKKDFWPAIKRQFTKESGELGYFIKTWVTLVESFNQDIRAPEELQLKQWITIEILMNRSMEMRSDAIKEIEKAEEKANEEAKKPVGERNLETLAILQANILNMRAAMTSFTSEFNKLQERQGKIINDLKATRDQRVKNIIDSKKDWAGLVRKLTEYRERVEVGEEAEKMRIAAEKKRKQLMEYTTFEDGEVDRMLLNAEAVEMEGEENG